MSRSVSSYAKIRTFVERGSSNPSICTFEIIDRVWTKNFRSVEEEEYRNGPLADYFFFCTICRKINREMIYLPLAIPLFFFFFSSLGTTYESNGLLTLARNHEQRQRNSRLHFIVGQTPAINDNSSMTRSQNRKENKFMKHFMRSSHYLNRDACTTAGSRLPEGKPNRKEASLKSSLLPPPPSPLLPPPPLL